MYQRQNYRTIARSLTKLPSTDRANNPKPNLSTQRKRIRTLEKEPNVQIAAMEQQLADRGFSNKFLHTLFQLRCEDNLIRPTEPKYNVFISGFYKKTKGSSKIVAEDHNLKEKSLEYFVQQLANIDCITAIDLSGHRIPAESITKLLSEHPRVTEIGLRNMDLQPQDIRKIIDCILKKQQIVGLDFSNVNSDGLNRMSEGSTLLERLLSQNKVLMKLELEGLNLRDKGVEALQRAFKINNNSNLFYLKLSNNGITYRSFQPIKTILMKGSIKDLDLSNNQLGDEGIEQLGQLKNTALWRLNLSNVGIQSKGLIAFLQRLKDSKQLQVLILDKNNFSNNWFMRIQEPIADNKSLQELRMIDCQIKYLEALFDGVTDNVSLKILNVSKNILDGKYKQLGQMIKQNQFLRQLRMRFCGLDAMGCRVIAEALQHNQVLQTLDISQNSVGIQTGKVLLSNLYSNNSLLHLFVDKTQIDLSTRKFMEEKLAMNMVEHNKRLKLLLVKENQAIKQKDKERKQNLQVLQDQVVATSDYGANLKLIVEGLVTKLSLTKKRYQDTVNFYDGELADINKQLIKFQVDSRPILRDAQHSVSVLNSKIEAAKHQKQAQQKNVKKLQSFLVAQRNRIRRMQDALQQQFENQKYLKKKQSFSLPKLNGQDSSPLKKLSKVVESRTAAKVQLKSK